MASSMFTQRHYEVIAEEISINYGAYALGGNIALALSALAKDLADRFETDNPAFKRDVFLRACGIE